MTIREIVEEALPLRPHVPIALAVRVLRRHLERRLQRRRWRSWRRRQRRRRGSCRRRGVLAARCWGRPCRGSRVAIVIARVAAGLVLRFIGEGALIEGIVRARQGGAMTTRRRVPRRLGALGRARPDRAALPRRHRRERRAAGGDRACSRCRRSAGSPASCSAFPRPSSPCRGSSRSTSCRPSPRGSPCSRTGARSTPSAMRGSSCTAGSSTGSGSWWRRFVGTLVISILGVVVLVPVRAVAGGAGAGAARAAPSSSSGCSCCCRCSASSPRCSAPTGRRSGRLAT